MKKFFISMVSLLILFSSCKKDSDEIIIGGAISLTGDNALQGNRGLNGMLLAIDMVNEKGGINGKKIRLISEDTQTTAKGAVNAYTKLIQADKVCAVMTTGDIEFLAINDATKKAKVVTVATICSGMLEENRSPYLFRYCFNEKKQDEMIMNYIKEGLGDSTVTVFYPNTLWGQEIVKYSKKTADSLNVAIKDMIPFETEIADQRSTALKVMSSNPRIISARGFGSAYEAVLRSLSELGYNGAIIGDLTISLPGSINNTKGIIEGAYSISSDIRDDSTISEDYKTRYREKYKEAPSIWDALGFDTCTFLLEAIKISMDDNITIEEAMYKVQGIPLLLGDNKFGSSNDVLFDMSVYKIMQGVPQLIK